MPIEIRDILEPLSRASFLKSDDPSPAESSAGIFLAQEMRRYCQGRINGRSFLISGHRGAGKTTLVASAFLKVHGESEEASGTLLRPLFVPMNGTTLLPPAEPAAPPAFAWQSSTEKPPEGAAPPGRKSETQGALEQITLCLYRALAKEVGREFRNRILPARVPLHPREERLRLELAAQLECELYEPPEPARLREFWRLGGLGSSQGARESSLFAAPSWRDPRGQSLRELVALASAADAYRRISGKLTQEDKAKEDVEESREVATGVQSSVKDLSNLLVVLLSGGLAGVGAHAAHAAALPSALAGLATALAAAAFFKVRYSQSRHRGRAREYNFLADLSVQSLDRALPILIDRVLEAGLAPIFVVDELDKVDELSKRMGGLVHQLKKLVAEQAFFCFLTDRQYFEEVQRKGLEEPYSVEYTYFTHRLYVVYSASYLHDYLATVVPAPETAPVVPGTLLIPDPVASQELADQALLPYVLLYRSKMHMLDLHRELALLKDDQGNLSLPPGRVRSVPFRLEVLSQMAVEILLQRNELVQRVEQSPTFLRLIHDALYYAAHKWSRGEDFSTEEEGLDPFRKHLFERAGFSEKLKDPARKAAGPERVLLSEEELRVLFNYTCQLAVLLSDWDGFWKAFEDHKTGPPARPVASFVTEALEALKNAMKPPLERAGGELRFSWNYDPLGQTPRVSLSGVAADPTTPEQLTEETWEGDVQLIEGIVDFLAGLSALGSPSGPAPSAENPGNPGWIDLTTLSTQLRVLSTSPAWPEAQRAMAALRQAQRETRSYRDAAQDTATVHEFAEMLRANGKTLAQALVWGARVGVASNRPTPAGRLLVGLQSIAICCQFADKSGDEVRQVLRRLESELPADALPAPPLVPFLGTAGTKEEIREWTDWISARIAESSALSRFVTETHLGEWKADAWRRWDSRLIHFFAQEPIEPPRLTELFCAAAGIGPTRLLDFRIEAMTLATWSTVLLTAYSGFALEEKIPPDLPSFALRALGFDPLPPIEKAFPVSGPPAGGPPVTPWVVILRQSQRSMVESWLPSKTCAALSFTQEQIQSDKSNAIPSDFFKNLAPRWLVVEEPFDPKVALTLKGKSTIGPIPIYLELRRLPRQGRQIVAPKSLDDLAAQLRSLDPTDPRAA